MVANGYWTLGDAGPAKIGSGFINNSAGMFFIAPTGAWNSTSGGVSMFGWFRLRPPGPDGDLNLMSATFLYDGNPGVGIGWNVGAGKFQFALGALAAPPSAVTDWFFLAFTFNNITGLQKLYFNGALIGQEINNGFLPGSAPQTQFNVYGGTGVFDGDEFGLSLQSEFSQDHILALYNGGAGKTWPAVDS